VEESPGWLKPLCGKSLSDVMAECDSGGVVEDTSISLNRLISFSVQSELLMETAVELAITRPRKSAPRPEWGRYHGLPKGKESVGWHKIILYI
jgi:hypothetical protein